MKLTKNMVYRPSCESRELTLYAENTADLYHRSIVPTIDNLRKKYRKGVYDREKAVTAFYHVACEASRMYCREFASVEDAPHVFDVTARFTCACDLLDGYTEDIETLDY